MARRILILLGHPDPAENHFAQALAAAYADGARQGGHELREVSLAKLDFPVLRSKADWEQGACPPALVPAQESLGWAEHIVIIYPLWLGDVPAHLKAFLEQVCRPGFAFGRAEAGGMAHKPLRGKTASLIVTMGMPGFVFRWFFLSHSVRSLKRNVLAFVGIRSIATRVIGMVETQKVGVRDRWLQRIRRQGMRGG